MAKKWCFLFTFMLLVGLSACSSNSTTTKENTTTTLLTTTLQTTTMQITTTDLSKDLYLNDASQFQQMAFQLEAGSTLYIQDGTYRNVNVIIDASGTKDAPIYIKAENYGQVFISGTSQFEIKGDYVIVDGLYFKDGEPTTDKGCLIVEGDHDRLTNNTVDSYNGNDKKWVSLSGKYTEVDHNLFTGKSTVGSLLTIWRNDNTPNYEYIHNNYFKDYSHGQVADNGFETIRVGTSTNSQSDSYSIIENNLFQNLNGEVEIVSIKSGHNLVKGNTVIDSKGMLTSRHGKYNYFENNVILQDGIDSTGGIRVYDGGHVIQNNYIQGVRSSSNTFGGITIGSGDNLITETTALNGHWTANNVLIENNTFYDNEQSILYGYKYLHNPTDITFKDNVIYSSDYSSVTEKLSNPMTNETFENELYYGPSLGLVSNTIPEGINYSTTPFDMSQDGQGLWLNATLGAHNLHEMTTDEVGPNYENFFSSQDLTSNFFTQNFIDWPFVLPIINN